ncbi:MAG: hypothetical protein U0768_08150 [Anaerolineae bacterium]
MRRIFARPRWWGLGLGLLALVLFFVASVQQAQTATAALGRADSGRHVAAYPGPGDTPAPYPAPATATLPPPGNPIRTVTPTATTGAAYPGPSETPGAYPLPATATATATLPLPPGATATLPAYPGATATLPLPPGATATLPAYPGATATLMPPYPGATATLPAYPGATHTPPAYPGPTRTATLQPPTRTPAPYPYPGTAIPYPYPGPTATPTAEAHILTCDDSDATHICHGVVAVKVFVDYQCNRVFNPTVDLGLADVDVQVRLDDGRTLTGHTDAGGEVTLSGVRVTRGHPAQVRVGKPTPPPQVVQGGLMLSLCGNSPAVVTLTDDSFSTEQRTNVAFRFAVR